MSERMGKTEVRDILISVALGYVLYLISLLSFLLSFPVLLLAKRYDYKKVAISALLLFTLIVISNLWMVRGIEFDKALFCSFVIGLFIPFSMLSSSVLWVKERGKKLIGRFLISVLPVILGFLAIGIWLGSDVELFLRLEEGYRNIFISAWKDLPLNVDFELLFNLAFRLFIMLYLPLIIMLDGIVFFVSSGYINSDSESFNKAVSEIRLDYKYIYLLLFSLMMLVMARFVNFPLFISILITSLLGIMILFYTFIGFSIIYYYGRKRRENAKALNTFFVLIAFVMFVPGVNIVLVFILSLLGILETWFTLRK